MTVNVFLEPVGRPLSFESGQFIFLAFGGVNGWQRHPFSVASAPAERARHLPGRRPQQALPDRQTSWTASRRPDLTAVTNSS